MSSILKTYVLGGLLMAVLYDLADRFYFPTFPIHIVLIPGGMMFAINGFLKPVANRAKYSYMVGVSIGFFYAITSFMVAYAAFYLLSLVNIRDWSFGSYYMTVTSAIQNSFPLIMISSLLMPMMYMSKNNPEQKSQTDILDQDL